MNVPSLIRFVKVPAMYFVLYSSRHIRVSAFIYTVHCAVFFNMDVEVKYIILTHCGPVTQICVFTLQLCKTDDANLRF